MTFEKLNLKWEDHVIIDKSLFRNSEIQSSYGDPKEMKRCYEWEAKQSVNDIIEKLIKYHYK